MATGNKLQLTFKLKLLVAVAIVIVLAIVAHQLRWLDLLQTALHTALMAIKDLGVVGVLTYIVIYNLATILFIPGSLLTLGGGALYGVVWGSIYVFIAATLGATLAFLIGRYITRDWVNRQIANNAKFEAIETAVAQEGLKIVFLARLSPIFPFNLLNYAFGVTQVSLRDYVLGSVGMIPGTVMYVYLGSLAGDVSAIGTQPSLDPQTQMLQWTLRIIGFMATVGVTLYVTHIAKKALANKI
ncbi:TVP38/TMEM64 family protein [Pantanalinema sp. GBBB05]|uniref:TVP38/TMEM64 family protein n=1 Tax=Pantanalinema sp. GBBB05 TaxID=2604139 RepID=UPI001DDC75ED|nr:TVP38/TMEM64 family protein [Pantanalinema sp. GBBB05]